MSAFCSLLFIHSLFSLIPVYAQIVFTVNVGDDGAFYTPQIVAATVGSIVNFRFVGTAHTVTQSSYNDPCAPVAGGFDSGFAGLAFQNSTLQNPMEWNLTITNDSVPIWYHCRASMPVPHCQVGMVGGINVGPPSTANQSFNAFVSAAKAAPVPQPTPSVPFSLVGFGATATATPALRGSASTATAATSALSTSSPATTNSATPTPTSLPAQAPSPPTQTSHPPSIGVIVGAAVGGCVVLVVICGLLYLLFRSRRKAYRLESEKMSRDGSSWLSTRDSSQKSLRPHPLFLK